MSQYATDLSLWASGICWRSKQSVNPRFRGKTNSPAAPSGQGEVSVTRSHSLPCLPPSHPAGRISLPCTMVLDREAQSTILRPDKLAINWPVGFTTSRSHINERLRETSLPRTPPRLCPLWENQLAGHPVEWVHCDGSLCGSPGSMGLFVLWIIQQASPALNNRGLYCMFNQLGRENQYVCQINSAWPWCASGLFGRIWKLTLGNGPPLVPLIWSLSW